METGNRGPSRAFGLRFFVRRGRTHAHSVAGTDSRADLAATRRYESTAAVRRPRGDRRLSNLAVPLSPRAVRLWAYEIINLIFEAGIGVRVVDTNVNCSFGRSRPRTLQFCVSRRTDAAAPGEIQRGFLKLAIIIAFYRGLVAFVAQSKYAQSNAATAATAMADVRDLTIRLRCRDFVREPVDIVGCCKDSSEAFNFL